MNNNEKITSNFKYKVGGSLAYEHPSYVKRKADEELYQNLKNGNFCSVFNSRQMGKSSLRVQIRKKLENEGVKCTSIDMTTIGNSDNPIESFYAGITFELWSGFFKDILPFHTWWEQQHILPPLQRLSEFIETVLLTNIPQNIVIFIDEIDNLINRLTKDEFLEFIRACYNQRAEKPAYNRLTFCLLGVVTPSDLKDKMGTPFNIGQTIELTGFKFAEARVSLTQGFLDQISEPERVLQEVLYWTGGQPFLTQKLCRLIADNIQNSRPNITDLVHNYMIDNWEIQDNPEHLRTIKNRLLYDKISPYILLKLYLKIWQKNQINSTDKQEEIVLRLSGLIVKKQGKLNIYNPIYKNIFNPDWIKKELNLIPKVSDGNLDIKNLDFSSYSFLVPTGIFLALIGGICLGTAYILVDSQPWNNAYNQNGMGLIIEFIRICILLIIDIYIIGSQFSNEFNQLLKEKRFLFRRKLIFSIGFIFLLILLFHHLYLGPHQLLGNNQVSENEYFYKYLLPYICYFPYSLINFIFIGVPFCSLSIHVVIEYCQTLGLKIQEYQSFIKRAINQSNREDIINSKTQDLYLYCQSTITSHINLFFCLLMIIYVGLIFSISTFSNSAYIWTRLFFLFCFITPLLTLVLWGLLAYRKTLHETLEILSDFNGDRTVIAKKYNIFNLLYQSQKSNVLGAIVSIIYILHFSYLMISKKFL